MSMLGDMLREDRQRCGFTVGQAASRFGVSPANYRELEAGTRCPLQHLRPDLQALRLAEDVRERPSLLRPPEGGWAAWEEGVSEET